MYKFLISGIYVDKYEGFICAEANDSSLLILFEWIKHTANIDNNDPILMLYGFQ